MAASGKRNYPMGAEVPAEIVLQKLEILLSRPEGVRCLADEDLRKARKNLATIRKYFSAEDRLSQSTELMGRLLRALYDAEEFIDKFYLEVACGRHEALRVATRPLAALVHKYMLWRDLSNLLKSMEELCQDQYLKGMTESDGGRDEPASFAPWEGQKLARLTNFWDQRASTDFLCFETQKQEITKQIEEEITDVHGTSIFGKQGTGKTFLARRVYREATNLGFDSHAWVHVSACTDKQEFLFEILKQLDKLARDSMDFNEIKKMLRRKLAKTKRFLIVLDDVHLPDQQFLQELLKIIPFPSQGHIITTTQDDTIGRIMSTPEPKLINPDFVCYETEKQEITKRISKELTDVHRISIFGKQGTGKTFLATWVYREAMNLGFESHAWVCVSACTDKQEFLFEILKQLDKLASDSMDFDEIKEMLRQKLSKVKKFLIVLDDVHLSDRQLLQELLMIIPSPSPSRGYLITTTQDDTLANIMNTTEGGRIELPKEDNIPNGCLDLPLCVSLLRGLKEHERPVLANESTVMSLSDILLLSYHRLPIHLKPCFIYMALFPMASPISTRRLVRLWLAEGLLDSHCCDKELKRTPEDIGETFILELADRKVIDVVSWRADGSPKACQMLTSLYDLICPTTLSTGFLYVHKASKLRGGYNCNPTGQQQQCLDAPRGGTKVRWLAEHTNIVRDGLGHSCRNLNLGHVRSFLSFCTRRGTLTKDISTFLRNTTSKADCSLLRVLDLEGVYKPSLQGVLRRLVLLRYLGLRSTVLDSIPSEVAHLHYLETLDMKHTNISSLPSPLWKKRNLRHLDLNWFYIDLMEILKACSNNVMALTQLQTLSGLIIGEVKEDLMRDHRHSLTTLTKLKLFLQRSGGDSSAVAGKAVADWISFGLTNLQSLTFGVIQEAQAVEETPPAKETPKKAQSSEGATKVEDKPTEETKPTTSQIGPLPELSLGQHHKLLELYLLGQLKEPIIWTQLLPGSLRVLTLSGSMVKTDMMAQLGDLLTYLRTFRLLANSFQGTRLRFAKDGFPSLLVLKFWKLPHLANVIIEEGAMHRLKELEFRHLDAMEKVEGIVDQCKELKNIRVGVKKSAHGFVEHLEEENKKRKNQYKIEEIVTPKPTDDDNDSP